MLKSSQPAWRRSSRTATVRWPLAVLALLAAVPVVRAADDPAEELVFRDNTEEVVRGAATLAGAGGQGGHGSAMVLALLLRGEQRHLWRMAANDRALPLSRRLLNHVKDSPGVRVDDAGFEPEAYCEALLKASLVSPGAFANSARADVTYAHLFNEPGQYRGQVIHYADGHVHRIRRFGAPAMVQDKGIHDLYECWLFREDDGTNPVCLVCTELPRGVAPGEHLNIEASFDAYFFKKYQYEAADSKRGHARAAPLFIGRTFVVTREPPAKAEGYAAASKSLLLIFLGGVLATFVFAFGLHWWFRRADRRVQAKIRELRTRDPGVLRDNAREAASGRDVTKPLQ